MSKLTRREKGFTIIEVVLVLAIAALIFLMVFVALPALQRGQRDTARKNDASVVAAAAQDYMSAEREALTVAKQGDFRGYIGDLDQYTKDDVSVRAQLTPNEAGVEVTPEMGSDEIRVYIRSKCDGTKVKAGVSRSAAVVIKLEGGSGTDYCVDV